MDFQPPKRPKYLPEDILLLVLYRLPVKSLIRFMCVCRTWYHLIATPSFAKTHLTYRNSPSNKDKFIFYAVGSWWKLLNYQSIFDRTLEESTLYRADEMLRRYGPDDYIQRAKIYGICDGLLCLAHRDYCFGDEIYLWNPNCRKIKKLPELDDSVQNEVGRTCKAFVSFGYYDDDYQVIVIAPIGIAYIVCVYSLSTNNWKFTRTSSWNIINAKPNQTKHTNYIHSSLRSSFGDTHYIHSSLRSSFGDVDCCTVKDSKFVGGTVYMIEDTFVRCFDLSNKTIRDIDFPKELWVYGNGFKTETYGDTIAIFGFRLGYNRFVAMWILRDKSSFFKKWEKKLDKEVYGRSYGLQGFINNGKYMIRRNAKFFMCDLEFPELTEIKCIHGLPFEGSGRTHSLVDSLLLLNEENLDPIHVKTESS